MRSPERETRVDARRIVAAGLLGFFFSTLVIITYARGDVDRMTSGDGLFYRYVAAHIDDGKSELDPIVAARGPALRYGRVGLPTLIWLLSGGRDDLMRYSQPLIMALAGGATAAAAATLLSRGGLLVALTPFLAVGMTLAVAGGYTEALAVAFLLWAAVAAFSERWIAASVLLALAMLSRENTVVILLGLAALCASKRRWRELGVLGCSVIPVAVWHAVVAVRFGHLPLADPYLWAGASTSKLPFSSLVRGFTDFGADAAITAAIHVSLWILAFVAARRSNLGWLAAAAGLQLMFVPLLNWQYLGDTFRLFSFLEVFTLLAVVAATSFPRPAAEAR